MRSVGSRRARSCLYVLLFTVLACKSEGTGPVGALSFDVVSGDNQQAPAGTELPNPLVVEATDVAGRPIAGMTVNFIVVSGGGSVFAEAVTTSSRGLAQDYWTLGASASEVQRVEVRGVDPETGAKRVFATFTATAVAGGADHIVPVSSSRTGTAPVWTGARVGSSLPDSVVLPAPAVQVLDQHGNPVPGATVTFNIVPAIDLFSGELLPPQGTITGSDAITDAQGVATIGGWAAGSMGFAINRLEAILPGAPPSDFSTNVYFSTDVYPDVATQLVPRGDNRSGTAGEYLPALARVYGDYETGLPHEVGSIVVQPQDRYGNFTGVLKDASGVPVLNSVPITFTVTSGDGCVKAIPAACVISTTATLRFNSIDWHDPNWATYVYGHGIYWKLGPTPGPNTLTASAPGLDPVTFTAIGQ